MGFSRTMAVCLLVLGITNIAHALDDEPDPGELFPNVKAHKRSAPSPVSKPEGEAEKPQSTTQPKTELPPTVAPLPPVIAAAKPKPLDLWLPYRARLLAPLMSADSQARFDREFMPRIKLAVKKKTAAQEAEALWKDAQDDQMPSDLRRALMLHSLGLSIEGHASLDDRSAKANKVLPLLTEETLAVAQARADAVTALAFGALANASDDLLTLVVESQCKLARMQVQAGFPAEADASLKAARDAYHVMKAKSDEERDTLAEAGGWTDRAATALAVSDRLKQTLAATRTDASANTQVALFTLSLYGDVRQAAPLAVNSDRKEMKAIAAAVATAKQGTQDPSENVAAAIAISTALLDLAESGLMQKFDRYSIGTLVETRLMQVTGGGDIPEDRTQQINALQTRAQAVAAKGALKVPTFPALAKLMGGGDSAGAAAIPATAKLVLFVKNNGTPVKYVKATPSEAAKALAMERKFIGDMSQKMNTPFVQLETTHCLVVTNFDASRNDYLKGVVEAAYAVAAKQFDFPLGDNVFPAKLPIFMLATTADYNALIKAAGKGSTKTTGYFEITDDGLGYIAIRQISASEADRTRRDAKITSESSLAWNMIGAFSSRYRTNIPLPDWLQDGMAAHVADGLFPDPARAKGLQRYAASGKTIIPLLTKPAGSWDGQSASMGIVDTLLARDAKAFIEFINKIKDGADQEAALKETYQWSFADLSQAWESRVGRK